MSSHSVSLTQSFLFIMFPLTCPRSCASRALSTGDQLCRIVRDQSVRSGGNTYHADVVSVQEELGKFDLGTGVVARR